MSNVSNSIQKFFDENGIKASVVNETSSGPILTVKAKAHTGFKMTQLQKSQKDLEFAVGRGGIRISGAAGEIVFEMQSGNITSLSLIEMMKSMETELLPWSTAIGVDQKDNVLVLNFDSDDVSHIFVAGATGSGKTAFMRTMAVGLAMSSSPNQATITFCDPKGSAFSNLLVMPHTGGKSYVTDTEITEILESYVEEMVERDRTRTNLPMRFIFIDEMADLVMSAGESIQKPLTRLAQRGRESGYRLIVGTQKPLAATLGSLFKANFTTKVIGKMANKDDAKHVSGFAGSGAEALNGKGDMLLILGGSVFSRFQAPWLDGKQFNSIVNGI